MLKVVFSAHYFSVLVSSPTVGKLNKDSPDMAMSKKLFQISKQKSYLSVFLCSTLSPAHQIISLEQECEWTLDHLLGGLKIIKIKHTLSPCVDPRGHIWPLSEVFVDSLMLEEQLLVAPQACDDFRSRDDIADQVV